MIAWAKALLIKAKEYINYITQVEAAPAARITLDSAKDDFSELYVSNVNTSVGYLRFYMDTALYQVVCDSEYIYAVDAATATYQGIRLQPTKSGIEIGNTYEIILYIADINDATKKLQKIMIYYTRTV